VRWGGAADAPHCHKQLWSAVISGPAFLGLTRNDTPRLCFVSFCLPKTNGYYEKGITMDVFATIWALLPPVIAIALALITKEVYSSLFIGIVSGALLYTGFDFVAAFEHIFYGTAEIDGETVELVAGDWMRIAPAGKRQLFAAEDEGISYACIQVRAGSLEGYTADDAIL
jgi:hypothetical protein